MTLVGKGVCFDTGGLDLKPASGMLDDEEGHGRRRRRCWRWPRMVMAREAAGARCGVLVPAVENTRLGRRLPADATCVPTRKGITVEIGNTDAEGRLILCDALHEGASEKPTMMVDCATLTGAARVALGTDLPALFCNDDALADDLVACGQGGDRPDRGACRLFAGYRRLLDEQGGRHQQRAGRGASAAPSRRRCTSRSSCPTTCRGRISA